MSDPAAAAPSAAKKAVIPVAAIVVLLIAIGVFSKEFGGSVNSFLDGLVHVLLRAIPFILLGLIAWYLSQSRK